MTNLNKIALIKGRDSTYTYPSVVKNNHLLA